MNNIYIFDCDGVIFDSNNFKTDAFIKVLEKNNISQSEISEFILYHEFNPGISRYVKFERLFTIILKIPINIITLESMLLDFSRICVQEYLNSSLTTGCLTKIKQLSVNNDLYIASGGDENELKHVFKKHKISKYFKEILGSPRSKNNCVMEIVDSINQKKVQKMFMIGDSESDYIASVNNNVEFIFMRKYSGHKKLMDALSKDKGFSIISDLSNLNTI